MWPLKKKIKQRRLEVRKSIPTARGASWRRFIQAGGPGSLVIALAFYVASASMIIWPLGTLPYRLGQTAPKVFARQTFEAPDNQATADARERAFNNTPSSYRVNTELIAEVEKRLRTLPDELQSAEGLEGVRDDLRKQFSINSPNDLRAFRQYADAANAPTWESAVIQALADLKGRGILTEEEYDWEREQRQSTEARLLAEPGSPARIVDKWVTLTSLEDKKKLQQELAEVVAPIPSAVRDKVRGYLALTIGSGRPTYRVDHALTEAEAKAAKEATTVQMKSFVADSLVFRGGRVTPNDLAALEAEHAAYRADLLNRHPWHDIRVAAGRATIALLLTLALCVYIATYQPRIVQNHMRGLAMTLLLLGMIALSKLMVQTGGWSPFLAIGAAVMGTAVITIAYNQRFALAVGAILGVMIVLTLRQDVAFLTTLLTPVVVSVLALKEVRKRSKLIEVGALAAMAVFVAATASQLAGGKSLSAGLLTDSGWAAGAVLAAGFIIEGLLRPLEHGFGIATSMTLLEWCDANKKLLKRLAMEAPGTYNHSLLLGTLCEAAAESIGANGLLARVGAYYHDVGKINKPEYFIENQFGSPSKHAKLRPAMSLLIITGHVKDGIEIAREYGLPPVLHQFIATHHGTTLVQYFYHAAAEQRKADGSDRLPEEIEYRYPGPKPQSKEAAILMLADAVESSVRAMSDPTPSRIEGQAHAIVTARLTDGQLDDCNLTLREVHKIEESLTKSLCGIYHGRIAYPAADSKTQRKPAPLSAGA